MKHSFRIYPKTYSYLFLTVVILLLTQWALMGCARYYEARRTTKKIARDIMVREGDLKKSIAIITFENQSYYTNDRIEKLFQDKITETLVTACTNLQLILPGDKRYPKALKAPPRLPTGRIDNLQMARIGRRYGIGAIATGAIVSVSSYQEKRGLYWLRDDHAYLQVQIHLEVFDTETGAKLMDENRLEEVEIEEDDYFFIKEKRQVPIMEIAEEVQFSATLLGEKICDSLINQTWKSYVISKDGKNVIVSSGENAGLQAGNRFEIYDTGELISGNGDEQFVLQGKKVGEIVITDIYPDKADAITIMDEGISAGDIVKPD